MTAQDDATHGTLAAMMEGYDRAILSKLPGMNGPLRRSSLMDFNAGASAALMVLESRINRGEEPRSDSQHAKAHKRRALLRRQAG